MKNRFVGVFLCLLAATLPARAAEEIFVLIPGIPGESVKAGHVNWIDAFALSSGVSVPSGGAGSPSFQDVSILKATDKATPLLLDAATRQLNLNPVTIEVCGIPVSGPSRCYYRLELSNVRLSAAGVAGAASCTSASSCAPAQTESISLTFTRIKTTYFDAAGTPTTRCWDLQANSAC